MGSVVILGTMRMYVHNVKFYRQNSNIRFMCFMQVFFNFRALMEVSSFTPWSIIYNTEPCLEIDPGNVSEGDADDLHVLPLYEGRGRAVLQTDRRRQ